MILFPIALIWLLCVLIWVIRNSMNESDGREQQREPRRWLPRPPRRPSGRHPHGSPSRGRAGARVRD
jgi:hypothetical protein